MVIFKDVVVSSLSCIRNFDFQRYTPRPKKKKTAASLRKTPFQKIGSQGLHVAAALESSHTRKRDVKRWQLFWTECVSGQSPAFTLKRVTQVTLF